MKNLNYVVKTIQDDLQDFSSKNYQKYLQKVIRGFYHLEYEASTNVNIAYLRPDHLGIAVLPNDFQYHTKIGININGTLVTLSQNTSLRAYTNPYKLQPCPNTIEEANQALAVTGNALAVWNYGLLFQSHFRNGQFVGEMYGLGAGLNGAGYYMIDTKLNIIVFSGLNTTTDIIMEYVSSGDANMNTLVDAIGADVCRMYAHWQLSKVKGYAYGDPDRNKAEYEELLWKYKDTQMCPTATELLDLFYDINTLSY